VNDRLTIPRPCIDMATVGYNVEWSQELEVSRSAAEYAKAWLLLGVLRQLELPEGLPEAERDVLFDLSVGYDLPGIRSRKVTGFLEQMREGRALIDDVRAELRRELPASLARLADAPVPDSISDCITLSTFHGCPPEQIESICTYLIEELGFHVVVKMNPTLIGYRDAAGIVNDVLGYQDVRVHEPAFAADPSFEQGVDLLKRLREVGKRRGRVVGAKFTNTLVVENHKKWLPASEPIMYLSGPPLYVLSMTLAARFRDAVGADLPISFSAGIDAKNYPDAVAAGLTPITTCSDLLKTGGYGRLHGYHEALAERLHAADAKSIDELILREGGGDDVRAASLRNHHRAVERAMAEPRYRFAKNDKPPKKIGSKLVLFNCVNCDKCVPVCPNDANFTYETPARRVRYRDLRVEAAELVPAPEAELVLGGAKQSTHQLANFADLCNDCGNCDVFCPEDGGPYIEKPRLFASLATYLRDQRPGFCLERRGGGTRLLARRNGLELELSIEGDTALFYDGFAELTFVADEAAPREARLLRAPPAGHVVPVGLYHSMRALVTGLLAPEATSYVALLAQR
jgi:putative selenate reductase